MKHFSALAPGLVPGVSHVKHFPAAMPSVRPAVSADVPHLERLRAQMGPVEAGHFGRCLGRGGCDLLVAEEGSRLLGWCLFNRAPKYRPFQSLRIPEVQDLAVGLAFRRRGVATALLDHCEAGARAEGRTRIGIGVGLHAGYGAAQALYARRGYVPDGAGATYDRAPVEPYALRPLDDHLCLMLVKDL